MSLTLELPDQLVSELSAAAARQGLSLPEYVLSLLAANSSKVTTPATGPELVAYWQKEGIIGMRPDIADSQAHARSLRQQAEHRS